MRTGAILSSPAFILVAFLALSTIFDGFKNKSNNGFVVVEASHLTQRPSCTDDETFVFKTKKDGTELGCNFVGKKRKKRCRQTEVREKCPVACQILGCTCRNSKGRFKLSSNGGVYRKKCLQNSDRDNGLCADPKVSKYCPLECESCGRVKCDNWPFGDPSLLSDGHYDKFSDSSIRFGGVYSLLQPAAPQQFLGSMFVPDDGYCPDTIDLFCVTKCHEDVDGCDAVTAVSINYGFSRRFTCQFFNSQVPDAPLRLSPFIPLFPLVNGLSANTYVLKKNEEDQQDIVPFESSNVVPPEFAPPNGSPSFQQLVLPGFQCVAANGGNPLECNACVTQQLGSGQVSCSGRACDEVMRLTCQSGGLFGEGGSCQDECRGDSCLELNQRAVLALSGIDPGPADPTKPPPYTYNDIGYGCVTKGVYDPVLGDFLDDYTCPPNQPKYVPDQPC